MQHHLFKLSAISIALFGAIPHSYAEECKVPITINNQQAAVVANCNIEELESINDSSSFAERLLINIKNSNVTLSDNQINHRYLDSNATGILDISDSKVSIKNSQMKSYTPPQGFLLKADNSEVSIDNSTLTGVGSSATKLFVLNKANVTINNSRISHPSLVSDETFLIHQKNNSVININHSTIESTLLWSDDRDYLTTPEGIITFNIHNSKIFTERLFRSLYTHSKGSVEFNVHNSDISGRWETSDNGLRSNITLNNSNWTIPYHRYFSSIHDLNVNNSEVIFERNPEKYQYLTIYGDLSGSGHFSLNTDLANQQADKIVVKGTDSGNFTLDIQDSGNEPQSANGKVTLVETQTGQAQFSLKDRDYVDAGAYRYRLGKEGTHWVLANHQAEPVPSTAPTSNIETVQTTPPTSNTETVQATPPTSNTETVQATPPTSITETVQATPLTSTTETVQATPSTSTTETVQPTLPTSAVNTAPSTPVWKSLSAHTNTLVSLRQAQGLLLSQDLHGVHQRLGEQKSEQAGNVWVKNTNGRQKADAQNVATDSRSSGFEMDYHHLYVGADRALSENVRLGGFVGSSRADVDFNGEYGKGKLRSQAVGFYTTFANADGWYLDSVAKYARLTSQAGQKQRYHTFSLSNEIGKQIAVGQGWTLTPQAQLAYHTLSGNVDERRLNLFNARAGVRVAKAVELGGWAIQPYMELNGLAETTNHAKVQVNQYHFDVAKNRGRLQTVLGINTGHGKHRIGLELNQTYGKQVRQPLAVQAGYRYQW